MQRQPRPLEEIHADRGASQLEAGKEKEETKSDPAWMSRALMKSRTIIAGRQVTDRMAQDVITRLLLLEQEDPRSPITVIINSPGGSADSGFAMYDAMKMVACPIRTLVVGLCASAGVTIFMGGDKGQKYATPYSRFLLHQPSTGAYGQAAIWRSRPMNSPHSRGLRRDHPERDGHRSGEAAGRRQP